MSADPAPALSVLARWPADGQPDRQEPGCHRTVRLGLGHTRDVSMIEREVEVLASPRCRIQAWRKVNEMPDRELMRDGRWLV